MFGLCTLRWVDTHGIPIPLHFKEEKYQDKCHIDNANILNCHWVLEG